MPPIGERCGLGTTQSDGCAAGTTEPLLTRGPIMLQTWTPVAETKRLAAPPRTFGAGTIAGYASLFGRVDLGGDVVAPGAFAASLARRGAGGIRMLFQHDPAEPIGTWDMVREDARGLYVRGRLALGVTRAREVWALLAQGAVDGLSIGFKAERARRDPRAGVRRLERVDLWEVSVVTFPMLPGATVTRIAGTDAASPSETQRR